MQSLRFGSGDRIRIQKDHMEGFSRGSRNRCELSQWGLGIPDSDGRALFRASGP